MKLRNPPRTKFIQCFRCQKEVEMSEEFLECVLESERCAFCEDFFCSAKCFDEHECHGHDKAA